MLKNEMESYVRKAGEGFEKSYIPLHGGGEGVENCLNLPCVINEWHLIYNPDFWLGQIYYFINFSVHISWYLFLLV